MAPSASEFGTTGQIPLFDVLTHPTLDGHWIPGHDRDGRIEVLVSEMASAGVHGGFAVGMGGIGGYSFDRYADFVRGRAPSLLPVAWVPFEELHGRMDAAAFVRRSRAAGYVGVKVHPRFAGIHLEDPRLDAIVEAAAGEELVILLCTHIFDARLLAGNAFDRLGAFLDRNASARIILLHGGLVRLLEVMQMAKAFPNTLVDLSYTLLKYEGSSIDLDLEWLFRNFDRRICVGSDHPEFRPAEMRRRFEALAAGLPRGPAENIAWRNAVTFAGVPHPGWAGSPAGVESGNPEGE
jgi:predicted TIM-barrel fold metal-dependent hydrolase